MVAHTFVILTPNAQRAHLAHRTQLLMLRILSSRRRHTIYIGDWSSDVCSSDLGLRHGWQSQRISAFTQGGPPGIILWRRSEERRVGKESRSRWSPHH